MNWLKKGTPYLPGDARPGTAGSPCPATIESPIGARVMLSTPAAITTSCVPDITAWAANWIACCEEPHWRSMVTAGTLCGSFEASTALRPTWSDCSPAWVTQPMITSSIAAGSIPDRSATAIEADRGEIDRMDAGEPPALAAPGGADGGDDIGFCHRRACEGVFPGIGSVLSPPRAGLPARPCRACRGAARRWA